MTTVRDCSNELDFTRAVRDTLDAGKGVGPRLLLDGDRLADIRALRRVRIVVAGGRAYDPAKLWRSVGFSPP